ncbi:MAG: response regulator [Bacteroidetes bacterium]|nr:response regulator [Bacteroidota bacterium]
MINGNYIQPIILIARGKSDGDNDLASLLLNKNISVIRVESGSEALRMFQTNPAISLALINADLAGLNGFDTTHEIRKLLPEVPIILFVNYVNIDSMRLSILVGCTRMLQNPVDPDELETIVEQYLIKCKNYV